MTLHSAKVSVVIPLYNKRGTIKRAIDSVLSQGVAEIEIIVVDDGSTDGSGAQVARLADDRIVLLSQANAGPGRARNAGAARATADLLAFLDGDDEWKPGFLPTALTALAEFPQAVGYACSFDTGLFKDRVKDKVSLLTREPTLLAPPSAAVGSDWLKSALDGLHSSATVVRTSAFHKAGGFYDRERCLWGEDSYLWAQILFAGPVYWDPTPRIFFHIEDSDLGFAKKYRRHARPLAEHGMALMDSIAHEHHAAFLMLIQKTASDDADKLAESGHLRKSLALRHRVGILGPRKMLGDLKRYLRHARHRRATTQ